SSRLWLIRHACSSQFSSSTRSSTCPQNSQYSRNSGAIGFLRTLRILRTHSRSQGASEEGPSRQAHRGTTPGGKAPSRVVERDSDVPPDRAIDPARDGRARRGGVIDPGRADGRPRGKGVRSHRDQGWRGWLATPGNQAPWDALYILYI